MDPEEAALGLAVADYRLIVLDTDHLTIGESVARVLRAILGVYGAAAAD